MHLLFVYTASVVIGRSVNSVYFENSCHVVLKASHCSSKKFNVFGFIGVSNFVICDSLCIVVAI